MCSYPRNCGMFHCFGKERYSNSPSLKQNKQTNKKDVKKWLIKKKMDHWIGLAKMVYEPVYHAIKI